MATSEINALSAHTAALTDVVPVEQPTGTTGGKTVLSQMLGLSSITPGGRLTLESGVPVSTTDQSAKTSLYYTPYVHDRLFLYDGTSVQTYTFTEITLATPSLTNGKNYDVFIYDNSGTLTLELSSAWTNDSTRADALAWQAGLGYVKSGTATRKWLGTIRASAANQMSDVGGSGATASLRFVANAYNRVPRSVWACPSYDDNNNFNIYTSSSTSWVEANGGTGNRAGYVFAVPGLVHAGVVARGLHSQTTGQTFTGLGFDSITSGRSVAVGYGTSGNFQLASIPETQEQAAGYHYLALLVVIVVAGTGTWYADIGRLGGQASDAPTTFLNGWILQ